LVWPVDASEMFYLREDTWRFIVPYDGELIDLLLGIEDSLLSLFLLSIDSDLTPGTSNSVSGLSIFAWPFIFLYFAK
jgi:hypothetical protein